MDPGIEKKKKKKLSLLIIGAAAYLLVFIGLIAAVYVYPGISGALQSTMTIEYGTLTISDDLEFWIIRDETVYFAAQDCDVSYNYAEGEMTRAGSAAVRAKYAESPEAPDYTEYNNTAKRLMTDKNLIKADDSELISAINDLYGLLGSAEDPVKQASIKRSIEKLESIYEGKGTGTDSGNLSASGVSDTYTVTGQGIVSYTVDGCESELNPYTMELLNRDVINSLNPQALDLHTGGALQGEPVFKTVNASEWYAVAWVGENELGKFEENKPVTLDTGEYSVDGEVFRLKDEGRFIKVIFRFRNYCRNMQSLRHVKGRIITENENGLIVDNSFLASEKGQVGVYVYNVAGVPSFVPVDVKATDGKESLVSSGVYYNEEGEGVNTVNAYDKIVKMGE